MAYSFSIMFTPAGAEDYLKPIDADIWLQYVD